MGDRLGWGRGGTLVTGGAANISGGAEFEMPTVFTVQLDVVNPLTAAFAIANIIWTLNGVTMVRKIDVAAGASISGMAESVRVIVTDETDIAIYPQGVPYSVSFNIADKPRATTAVPPIYTALSYETINATDSTDNIAVPSGANGIAIFGANSDGTTPQLTLTQYGTLTGGGEEPLTGNPLFVTGVTLGQYVPLVAGAGYIVVENTGAKNATINVEFSIDG